MAMPPKGWRPITGNKHLAQLSKSSMGEPLPFSISRLSSTQRWTNNEWCWHMEMEGGGGGEDDQGENGWMTYMK